uniref:Uncharacterized protein n=1 Tax=Romanomermis culicivorax TaxID=13658 RepID=A0A915I4U0_ROMCU
MQASIGAKNDAAAKTPAKPTGHYIDVKALPPPITSKIDKVAPNLNDTKAPAKEKFAKPGAYGTMMGI